MHDYEERCWLLLEQIKICVDVFVHPVMVSICLVVESSLSSLVGRLFGGLSFDQACNVTARNAEHYRQSLMQIPIIAWLAVIELRQSFDRFGEVKPSPP